MTIAGFTAVFAAAIAGNSGGAFTWGGIDAHPAVVNPVIEQSGADVISLRGTWLFAIPPKVLPNRNGVWGNFFNREKWENSRELHVPGCWEAQGVGEPGMGECWDPVWDNTAKPIRHKHVGEGGYRKDVPIPAQWAGRRIWIKFGGVKSVGWVWVNGNQIAMIDNYCATVKYEITDFVKPGETARIVVDVDNSKPSRKGLMSATHRWGGIYRDVELEATPRCFIDDAWARGDFDRREAEIHVALDGEECPSGAKIRAEVDGCAVEVPAKCGDNTLRIGLKDFRPWSPAHPNLYTATVELVSNGQVVHSRKERFGVRKIEVCGKEFRLNGKPFFMRGFGDDFVYPLTGMSPADREYHKRNLMKAKAAGFNYVRLHTHCEYPEYFEAADEVGIMIQAELPYYSDVPTEGFAFDPKRDIDELWANYRRHPSFVTYSMGNEGSFGPLLDRRLHEYVKKIDPDRLKISQDTNRPELSSPDRSDYSGGPVAVWPRGSFDPDRPFVTHEYLNLCVKLDCRDEKKYDGAWLPPATREARGKWLSRFGLGHDWGDALQDAQHVLQAQWQKRGIESARIDPHCDGYIFWTIVDVVVLNRDSQAYSAQGLLNPFWETKRKGFAPEDFAMFNSQSCVLADIFPARSVFVSGESFKADIHLALYGEDAMSGAKAKWNLSSADVTLAEGEAEVGDLSPGAVRRVASVEVKVPTVTKPVKASYSVSIGKIRNSWDLWLFPKGPSLDEIRAKAAKLGVVIAESRSAEAKEALASGRPLVTVDGAKGAANISLGWWWMGRQVGTAIRNHRVLGSFPHEGALTPLMFRILKQGRELPVPDVHPDDMVIVGEGGDKCYLYLAVKKVGRSRVVECNGLDVLSDLPEGNALLDAFVEELSRERPVRVVAFGDSITQSTIGIKPEENWLRILQKEFGDSAEMFNAGVGGNSAREAMRRLDRDVLRRNPDIVMLEFGGNNHRVSNLESRVDDDEFSRILEDFSARMPPGVRVVAVTFPPIKDEWHAYGKHPAVNGSLDEAMQSQRALLRDFARRKGWPVVDLYDIMKDRREEFLLRDGVHLNPKGQRVFAEAAGKVLKEEILRRKGLTVENIAAEKCAKPDICRNVRHVGM